MLSSDAHGVPAGKFSLTHTHTRRKPNLLILHFLGDMDA